MSTLELKENPTFQRHEHIAQRTGWVILATFLFAAALGLFGKGPLASKEVEGHAIRAEFDRFVRHSADTRLLVELDNNGANEATLWMSGEFIDKTKIELIEPEPVRTVIHSDENGNPGVEYVFSVDPTTEDLRVEFTYKPETIGRIKAQVSTGTQKLDINQIVYP